MYVCTNALSDLEKIINEKANHRTATSRMKPRELAFLPQRMKTLNICPLQPGNKGGFEMAVCEEVEVIPALRASIENKQTAQACPRTPAAKHQPGSARWPLGPAHRYLYL